MTQAGEEALSCYPLKQAEHTLKHRYGETLHSSAPGVKGWERRVYFNASTGTFTSTIVKGLRLCVVESGRLTGEKYIPGVDS